MACELTRRRFLRRVVRAGILGSLAAPRFSSAAGAFEQPFAAGDLANLDGSLVYDAETLGQASSDYGRVVLRRPRAVLRPGSVQDVVRAVQYAHRHRLPVAMRGRGTSRYGLPLVDGGIVIDSRSLNKVGGITNGSIEVEAGSTLVSVAQAALDTGSRLPVTIFAGGGSQLSVGGFLSVGGQSIGSLRLGAFVDNVRELSVVTGDGRLVVCSETRETELFEMMLAGLGQCGIIVGAKFPLVPAPEEVVTRRISYDAIEPFLENQERLLAEGGPDLMSGAIRRLPNGGWEYVITIGLFGAVAAKVDPAVFIPSNGSARVSEPIRRTYRSQFLGEASSAPVKTSSASTGTARAEPTAPTARPTVAEPSLAVWLPASSARELIASLLSSPQNTAGITSIECTGLNTEKFRRPLFRVPSEPRMFAFWTLRSVLADSGPNLETQLAVNADFVRRAVSKGAKRYPPYGGMTTPDDWRLHYGEALYRRFAAAKDKYDPRGILTPGPHIFQR
jgi:FAD/FMN-containing dehydrogenase